MPIQVINYRYSVALQALKHRYRVDTLAVVNPSRLLDNWFNWSPETVRTHQSTYVYFKQTQLLAVDLLRCFIKRRYMLARY